MPATAVLVVWKGRYLKVAPDVLEFKETLTGAQPFRTQDGAFGESPAGLGVVAEVDAIGSRVEGDLVHPDHLAFTKRSNFQFRSAALPYDFAKNGSGAGGRVFL